MRQKHRRAARSTKNSPCPPASPFSSFFSYISTACGAGRLAKSNNSSVGCNGGGFQL
jgi:hypothetical protein